MSKNLGKFLLLSLLFCVELFATTYKWSAYSSKKEAYIDEAIYLKYVCEFSDIAELYSIDFNPMTENEKYSLKLLSEETKIKNGKRLSSYEFVAFVKEPMVIDFSFDVLMKKTTQDSIDNTVLGRDNVEKEEFTTKHIKLESLKVQVEETNSSLLGDFTLIVESDKTNIKAYEPYHLKITIQGRGDFQALKPIEFKIDGVKVFQDKPIEDLKLTKDGYEGSWNQSFAFTSEKDFKIPDVKIEYFDIKTKSLKSMVVKSISVKVSPAFEKEELLDKEPDKWKFNFDFIYYILTFIAGFLVAKIKFKKKLHNSKHEVFIQKVKNAKSLNELSMLLILEDSTRYKNLISDIESKKVCSLSDAKRYV